jgi:hypothetical protein
MMRCNMQKHAFVYVRVYLRVVITRLGPSHFSTASTVMPLRSEYDLT